MTVGRGAERSSDQVNRDAGFSGHFDLGRRPAVLVVDFCRGFTEPESPLGSEATAEVQRSAEVLRAARTAGGLVVFTTISYAAGTAVTWLRKVPSLAALTIGSPWVSIDPRPGRREDEAVIAKSGASAFFGTALASLLVGARVDTVLVLGATTSGCVRASVVDSVQHGFATFVVTDCCVDRASAPHKANLFDMTAKYADPLDAAAAVEYLQELAGVGS